MKQMNEPAGEWLSAHQACRRLGVSRPTLLRLIDEGTLPAYRIGRMIRLTVADVEAFKQSRSKEQPGS